MEQEILEYKSHAELDDLCSQMRALIYLTPRAAMYTKFPPSEQNHADEIHSLKSTFLIRFLRAMKYDVKKAVELWTRSLEFRTNVVEIPYWKGRMDLKDFEIILKDGFITFPKGMHDATGRQIGILRPRLLNPHQYDKKRFLQCFWTIWEHILDDEALQMNGVCMFIDAENIGPRNFERKIQKSIGEAISHRLPIRIGRVLVVNPPAFFNVIWGVINLILSNKIKSRFRVVSGIPPTHHSSQPPNKKSGGIQSNIPTPDINSHPTFSFFSGSSRKSMIESESGNSKVDIIDKPHKVTRRERKNRENFEHLLHVFKEELGVVNISRKDARIKAAMLVGAVDSTDDVQIHDDEEILEFRLWPVEYDGDVEVPWGNWWNSWIPTQPNNNNTTQK